MKKILIVGGVCIILGIVGVWVYKNAQCTNEYTATFQHHRVFGCALYYDESVVDPNERIDAIDSETMFKLTGVHVPSFREIDDNYGKDKRSVYYRGREVSLARPDSFHVITGEYYADDRTVFWRGQRVEDAHVETFTTFEQDERYARDASQEFFNGRRIELAGTTTSSRFLLAPFDGQEITKGVAQDIFWLLNQDESIASVALALVGDDGSFQWIFDESQPHNGLFSWLPSNASTSPKVYYRMVFYGHRKDTSVIRFDIPTTFSVVEKGAPDVVLKVAFSEDPVVSVDPNENVYVSWASSNVVSCSLGEGVPQEKVGHMTVRFPQVGESKVTQYVYTITCVAQDGTVVEDVVTVNSVAPSVESSS